MKKCFMLLLTVVCAVMLLAGCQGNKPSDTTANKPSGTTAKEPSLPVYQPGSIKLQDQETDIYPFERKYRITYYRIWGEFISLVPEEQLEDFYAWSDDSAEQTDYGAKQEEMLLVAVIKRYNIPREEFDKAVEEFVEHNRNSGIDPALEEYEVPNGDIIYTFDNEIINEYYRYE